MSHRAHLLTLDTLEIYEIMALLESAKAFKEGKTAKFDDLVMANLFFEPSTRTQYSFEMAQKKLGIQTITFNELLSSTSKGEILYDTVKTFEALGVDGMVIRHPEKNYFEQLVDHINVPIFNGGDGSGNHPSQSLLDLLTIWEEFGDFNGLKIAIVGDVANSRVAHTNIQVMKRLGMDVHLVAPIEFREPGYTWYKLEEVIGEMDIIMLLRVQHERHDGRVSLDKLTYHDTYGLNAKRLIEMKKNAIVMHPAPINRGVEIADEIVESPKSRIFKQMQNGVFVRMAIIARSFE